MRGENADEEEEEEEGDCDDAELCEEGDEDPELGQFEADSGDYYQGSGGGGDSGWQDHSHLTGGLHGSSGSAGGDGSGLQDLHELRTMRDIQDVMRGQASSPFQPGLDERDHSGQFGSLNHSLMDAFNQHSGDHSSLASGGGSGVGQRRGMFADSVGSGRGLFQAHSPPDSSDGGRRRDLSRFEEDSDIQDDALMYGSLNNSDEAPFTP